MSEKAPEVREALAVYTTEAPEAECVPLGYRQTEVGVIPEDWEVKAIHEVATVSSGGTPNRSNPAYWGGNIPWATTAQIDFNRIATFEQFLTKDGLRQSAAKIFPSGTLLMAMYGQGKTRGKVGILGIAATTNQACAAILLDDTVSHEYVFQYLSSKYESIRKLSNTGNQENLNGRIIKSIRIPVPSEEEQRAIAAALSDVDVLIAALNKLIAKKRAVKTAAMQQLLTGKQRLPGFSGEWTRKRLGDIGEVASAGVDKKVRPEEIPVRLLNYLDVYDKDFIYSGDLTHIVSAPPAQADRCVIRKGDVFFTPSSEVRDDVGHSTVAMEDVLDAAYSYHIVRLRLHNNWDLRFRGYAFKSKEFYDQAQILCQGSGTRYVISKKQFSEMTIRVPPFSEQTAIAAVLSDMDAEIEALEARREKTRRIKRGMMQELLTGRTRLV